MPAVSRPTIDTLSNTSRRFCRLTKDGRAKDVPAIRTINTIKSVVSRRLAIIAARLAEPVERGLPAPDCGTGGAVRVTEGRVMPRVPTA